MRPVVVEDNVELSQYELVNVTTEQYPQFVREVGKCCPALSQFVREVGKCMGKESVHNSGKHSWRKEPAR